MCHWRRTQPAPTPPSSPFSIPPSHLHLVWHFWTRAANAACETINHEIENAAADDDNDDDDLKSKSMQSRLLIQFRQAAESGLPFSPSFLPSPFSLTSCAHLFHFCGQAGARKCQSVRVPCPSPSACLRVRAPKVQQEGRRGRWTEATHRISLYLGESSNVTLLRPTQKPHDIALAMPLGGSLCLRQRPLISPSGLLPKMRPHFKYSMFNCRVQWATLSHIPNFRQLGKVIT